MTLTQDHLDAMAAGRKRARFELIDTAVLKVMYYEEFLHEEAEHWAKHGRGLSWAKVEVPTDAEFAMARS